MSPLNHKCKGTSREIILMKKQPAVWLHAIFQAWTVHMFQRYRCDRSQNQQWWLPSAGTQLVNFKLHSFVPAKTGSIDCNYTQLSLYIWMKSAWHIAQRPNTFDSSMTAIHDASGKWLHTGVMKAVWFLRGRISVNWPQLNKQSWRSKHANLYLPLWNCG